MKLGIAIGWAAGAEAALAAELEAVAEANPRDSALARGCQELAGRADVRGTKLDEFARRYGGPLVSSTRTVGEVGGPEADGLGLLDDLRGLYVLSRAAEIAWLAVCAGAEVAPDRELIAAARGAQTELADCSRWIADRVRAAASSLVS